MRTTLVAIGIAVVVWLVAIAGRILAGRKVEAKQPARLLPGLAALQRALAATLAFHTGSRVLVGLAIV